MKSLYYLIPILFSLISIIQTKDIPTKRILMILFPGGNKQHILIKELLDFSFNNPISDYNFEYHLILYKSDLPQWKANSSSHNYHYYTYGTGNEGLSNFDTIQGVSFITSYIKWLKEFSQLFLSSNIMPQLKEIFSKTPFDLIATDIPNYVSVLLQQEFDIPLKMYLSPRPLPQLFYDLFEVNTNYVPAIGSKYSNKMNFNERFDNFFSLMRDRYLHWRLHREQVALFKQYNYSIKSNMFIKDAMNLIHYPKGLVFPMSTPPNFIFLNAIRIDQGKEIKSNEIITFTEQYKNIIYITEEAFDDLNALNLNSIGKDNSIGFIIQSNNNTESLMSNSPLIKTNLDSIDILSIDNVKCLISSGNIEYITQSLYNYKPMILLDKGIPIQNNILSVVHHNKLGLYETVSKLKKEGFIKAINQVCLNDTDNQYKSNAKVIGDILKGNKDAKKEYVSWLNYGFKHSYKTLIVPLYFKGNWFSINCLDVIIFLGVIILTIILIIRFILNKMFGTCTKDKKRTKIKKD